MTVVLIIQTILAGVFGWFVGELFGKSLHDNGNVENFKWWKILILEIAFIACLFTSDYLATKRMTDKEYNTKEYAIETIDTTFEADSTEVTTFKIVKK